MNYHILLKDGKAWAVDVPEIKFVKSDNIKDYEELHQHAIDNAVPFKENQREPLFIVLTVLYEMKEGKLYDCPSGFEIVIEGEHATLKELKG